MLNNLLAERTVKVILKAVMKNTELLDQWSGVVGSVVGGEVCFGRVTSLRFP